MCLFNDVSRTQPLHFSDVAGMFYSKKQIKIQINNDNFHWLNIAKKVFNFFQMDKETIEISFYILISKTKCVDMIVLCRHPRDSL